jgi:hypothetical protein
MNMRLCAVSAAAMLATAGQSWSAVLYINDLAGYDTAIGGLPLAGTENFETLFPTGGDYQDLSGLNGTVINADLGLKVTAGSFNLGGVGTTFGLGADSNSLWDGVYGTLKVQVAPSSGKPVLGLSLDVLSWNGTLGAVGTPDIKVYNLSGTLIGSGTVAASTMASASGFVGIVASPGESISKIVLTPTSSYTVGVDNFAAAVPEPATYTLALGICALGVGFVRRCRRSVPRA